MARSSRVIKNNFGKRLKEKSGFLASTYITLAVQLAITALCVYYLRDRPELQKKLRSLWILWLILSIGIILLLGFCPMPIYIKLLLFAIFAIILSFTMMAASEEVSIEAIQTAIISTVGIFIAMTVTAFVLAYIGVDLSFLGYMLLSALLGLIITNIVMIFVHVPTLVTKIVLIFAMILFSLFIAYDTNLMLQPNYHGTFVDAAIGLYINMVNIFNDVLAFNEL